MALRELPDASLEDLIRAHLTTTEGPFTLALIERVRPAIRRGYMTKGEFRAVCDWKSPRSRPHVYSNNHHRIRKATAAAIGERSDRAQIEPLLELNGVSIPTASAILTMIDPKRYGVIDIRVWQLLHGLGLVDGAPGGTSLTIDHWEQFLNLIRQQAAGFRVTARDIERTLFWIHREHQAGTLYRKATGA